MFASSRSRSTLASLDEDSVVDEEADGRGRGGGSGKVATGDVEADGGEGRRRSSFFDLSSIFQAPTSTATVRMQMESGDEAPDEVMGGFALRGASSSADTTSPMAAQLWGASRLQERARTLSRGASSISSSSSSVESGMESGELDNDLDAYKAEGAAVETENVEMDA